MNSKLRREAAEPDLRTAPLSMPATYLLYWRENMKELGTGDTPRLAYPIFGLFDFFFSAGTVFFSHNNSVGTVFFSQVSDQRTGPLCLNRL